MKAEIQDVKGWTVVKSKANNLKKRCVWVVLDPGGCVRYGPMTYNRAMSILEPFRGVLASSSEHTFEGGYLADYKIWD